MMRAYGRSKLCNILFTRELASRLDPAEVAASCLHPGMVATAIGQRGGLVELGWRLYKPFMISPEQGADTPVFLATVPDPDPVPRRLCHTQSARRARPGRAGQRSRAPIVGRERAARRARMSWIYLVAAGFFEIGWPVGLKWAQEPGKPIIGIALAVLSMAASGGLLFLAQREIALGTAYAVWTGIGAAGTFMVGVWLFNDPSSLGRYLGVVLIVAGVVTLKLAH